eukprot:gene3180-5496_t
MFSGKQRKLIGIGGILSMFLTGAVIDHYYGVPFDDKILMTTTDLRPKEKKLSKNDPNYKKEKYGDKTGEWISNQNNLSFLENFGKLKQRVKRVETELKLPIDIEGRKNENLNLKERMEVYNVPGISISVIENYQIDYTKVYGVSKDSKKLNLNHLFPLGQFGHFLSSILALRLVSQNKLSLGMSIGDQLKMSNLTHENLESILTGKSKIFGLEESFFSSNDSINLNSILSNIQVKNDTEIGNHNFSIGAEVVLEKLILSVEKEKSLFNVLDTNIFQKFDINNFKIDPFKKSKRNIAYGHHKMVVLEPLNNHISVLGMWSNTSNVARIFCELIKSNNKMSEELLNQDFAQKFFTSNSNVFGCKIEGDNECKKILFKNRKNGYSYYFIGYPNIGKGAILISNSDTGTELLNEVVRSISKVYEWPDLKQMKKTPIGNLDKKMLTKILGNYELDNNKKCKISLNDSNRLYFSYGNLNIKEQMFTNDYKTFFNQSGLMLHFDKNHEIFIESPMIGTKHGKFIQK